MYSTYPDETHDFIGIQEGIHSLPNKLHGFEEGTKSSHIAKFVVSPLLLLDILNDVFDILQGAYRQFPCHQWANGLLELASCPLEAVGVKRCHLANSGDDAARIKPAVPCPQRISKTQFRRRYDSEKERYQVDMGTGLGATS